MLRSVGDYHAPFSDSDGLRTGILRSSPLGGLGRQFARNFGIKIGTQAVHIAGALEFLPSQQPQNNTPEPYFSSCTSIPGRSYPLVHGTTATKGAE